MNADLLPSPFSFPPLLPFACLPSQIPPMSGTIPPLPPALRNRDREGYYSDEERDQRRSARKPRFSLDALRGRGGSSSSSDEERERRRGGGVRRGGGGYDDEDWARGGGGGGRSSQRRRDATPYPSSDHLPVSFFTPSASKHFPLPTELLSPSSFRPFLADSSSSRSGSVLNLLPPRRSPLDLSPSQPQPPLQRLPTRSPLPLRSPSPSYPLANSARQGPSRSKRRRLHRLVGRRNGSDVPARSRRRSTKR